MYSLKKKINRTCLKSSIISICKFTIQYFVIRHSGDMSGFPYFKLWQRHHKSLQRRESQPFFYSFSLWDRARCHPAFQPSAVEPNPKDAHWTWNICTHLNIIDASLGICMMYQCLHYSSMGTPGKMPRKRWYSMHSSYLVEATIEYICTQMCHHYCHCPGH